MDKMQLAAITFTVVRRLECSYAQSDSAPIISFFRIRKISPLYKTRYKWLVTVGCYQKYYGQDDIPSLEAITAFPYGLQVQELRFIEVRRNCSDTKMKNGNALWKFRTSASRVHDQLVIV